MTEEQRLVIKERKRLYYLANKDRINARNRLWRTANKERDDATKALYWRAHKDAIRSQRIEVAKTADPEKRRIAQRRYRDKRKEAIRQYAIDYRHLHPERTLVKNAKVRADKFGLPFNITHDDISIPEFCPVLGIRLKKGTVGQCESAPSLDRIRPGLGYVKGNVAVISKRANTIKSYGSLEDHERIVAWMRKELGADSPFSGHLCI